MSKKKKALITGISGQDGAYLARLLIKKGYNVIGGIRCDTRLKPWRLEELGVHNKVKLIPFELLDEKKINQVIKKEKFNEIYNLAAQSFVDKSFLNPVYTNNVNALGVMRILESIRNFSKKTKFYQASSSEMFGNVKSKYFDEKTSFQPISPYAVSKLNAHWMINLYRDAYGLFCCSGILFNHESPLRSDEYVSKKIISELIKIKHKKSKNLILGNIYAERDWGYADDYVEAMWKMLQQKKPEDYVISSGMINSVKTFINKASNYLGFDLKWTGSGLNEKGIDSATDRVIIKIDKKFFRPIDIQYKHGKSDKAKKNLNWKPKTNFDNLVKLICDAELKKYK